MESIEALLVTIGYKVLIFVGILIVSYFVVGILMGITNAALKKQEKIPDLLSKFISKTLFKIYWILALLVAVATIGIEVLPFITGLGIAGFILGFAFQDTLGNLAAGMMLLIHSPFDVGHYVEVAGVSGSVQEINLAATVLHTPDNKRVVVPNSNVWGSAITNYSFLPTRRLSMEIGVSYDTDIQKAKDILKKLIKEEERCLEDPAPTVELLTMADSSLNLCFRPWVNTPDFWGVYFALNQRIKEEFDKEGIEIPFPQRDLHLRDMPADLFKAMGNKELSE